MHFRKLCYYLVVRQNANCVCVMCTEHQIKPLASHFQLDWTGFRPRYMAFSRQLKLRNCGFLPLLLLYLSPLPSALTFSSGGRGVQPHDY